MSSAVSEMPQDSVLRRHWQAAREMEAGSKTSSSHATSPESQSGFFAWLKSLFS